MSQDKLPKTWLKDFRDFLEGDEIAPPVTVTQTILRRVRGDINPSLRLVTIKLGCLHAVSALLVTMFCPQLGVGPFLGEFGLMEVFMRFGSIPCAALCGALFLGTTALLATLLLKRQELRLANHHRFANFSLLASLSLIVLMIAGGDGNRLSYLFWILGALAGGWLVWSAGTGLRLHRVVLTE